jgi:hypothetical protein
VSDAALFGKKHRSLAVVQRVRPREITGDLEIQCIRPDRGQKFCRGKAFAVGLDNEGGREKEPVAKEGPEMQNREQRRKEGLERETAPPQHISIPFSNLTLHFRNTSGLEVGTNEIIVAKAAGC